MAMVTRWMSAGTPASACAEMSSGFRFFVGRGDYFRCAALITSELGPPSSSQRATIQRMSYQAGQVVVYVTISGGSGLPAHDLEHPPGPNRFYFVRQRGVWKLNSIGDREGLGPPAPGAPRTPPLKP